MQNHSANAIPWLRNSLCKGAIGGLCHVWSPSGSGQCRVALQMRRRHPERRSVKEPPTGCVMCGGGLRGRAHAESFCKCDSVAPQVALHGGHRGVASCRVSGIGPMQNRSANAIPSPRKSLCTGRGHWRVVLCLVSVVPLGNGSANAIPSSRNSLCTGATRLRLGRSTRLRLGLIGLGSVDLIQARPPRLRPGRHRLD